MTIYDSKVIKSFRIAYDFWDNHKLARTPEDWEKIAVDMSEYSSCTNLSHQILLAVVDEIEEEYYEYRKKNGMSYRELMEYEKDIVPLIQTIVEKFKKRRKEIREKEEKENKKVKNV